MIKIIDGKEVLVSLDDEEKQALEALQEEYKDESPGLRFLSDTSDEAAKIYDMMQDYIATKEKEEKKNN